jgi:hypothetical protein
MRSIFLSNKASLLAVAAETLLLMGDLDAIIAAEAETEEVIPCPFFTSLFVTSFQLYKTVFNTFLFRNKKEKRGS